VSEVQSSHGAANGEEGRDCWQFIFGGVRSIRGVGGRWGSDERASFEMDLARRRHGDCATGLGDNTHLPVSKGWSDHPDGSTL